MKWKSASRGPLSSRAQLDDARAGLVKLGLATPEEVAGAAREIQDRAQELGVDLPDLHQGAVFEAPPESGTHTQPSQPNPGGATAVTVPATAFITSDPDGTVVGWSWDFGDGNSSTVQHPVHTYTVAGTYTVTLIISDGSSCEDTIQHNVLVWPNPVADFTTSPVCVGYITDFFDQSTANADSLIGWAWDFGDGGTSTVQNPTHIYANGGLYSVTLTVMNADSCVDDTTITIEVYEAPEAIFTSDAPACDGDSICFTDQSISNATSIVSYQWLFGDGATSTDQNPCHVYATQGIYNVTLTVTNDLGCIDDTVITVEVYPNPVADFTYQANCDYVVDFTDLSIHNATSITNWVWTFGDGGSSTVQNPTYTYATHGTYNVQLIVVNDNNCIDSITLPVIVPEMPIADFTADTACEDSPTQFTDLSISNSSPLISWDWDFGDGTGEFADDPSHEYPAAGTYLVTISDSSAICGDTTYMDSIIVPR